MSIDEGSGIFIEGSSRNQNSKTKTIKDLSAMEVIYTSPHAFLNADLDIKEHIHVLHVT